MEVDGSPATSISIFPSVFVMLRWVEGRDRWRSRWRCRSRWRRRWCRRRLRWEEGRQITRWKWRWRHGMGRCERGHGGGEVEVRCERERERWGEVCERLRWKGEMERLRREVCESVDSRHCSRLIVSKQFRYAAADINC